MKNIYFTVYFPFTSCKQIFAISAVLDICYPSMLVFSINRPLEAHVMTKEQ